MKRILYFLFAATLALSACRKNNETDIQPITLNIKVAYNAQTAVGLPTDRVAIKLKNVNTGNIISLNADQKGTAKFENIPAGIYDIDASVTFTSAEYNQATNSSATSNVVFNASEKSKQIAVGFSDVIQLKLVTGTVGDWVIKQIYYNGSHRTNGALYRDQFIEFYNNSDKILYADSLCFAELTGQVGTTSSYNLLDNKQLDWSKSVGMPSNIDANNDYVYARALLMIPGTGKQYPVQPGKSIVVAQTAINHKSPFTGNDGKTISVIDPSLTVDLSDADFEAYYAPYEAKPLASDIDTKAPNLVVYAYFGNDMIFDANGKYGYALIKSDGKVSIKDLPMYNYPTKSTPSSTATKYYQIPNSLILDAVEVQPTLAADVNPKKLNPILDAGAASTGGGSYSSQSIIRKTDRTVNGRIILKDTNNSTEDFDFFTIANPRGFK